VGNKGQIEQQRAAAEEARQAALQQGSTCRGSLSVVQENARAAKRALGDPRYHQIHERHRKQIIEV
jgi:hypothetical protein